MKLIILVAAIVFVAPNKAKGQQAVCEEGAVNRVPYNFVGADVREYSPSYTSGSELRIFTTLRVTCDGLLSSWRFMPRRLDVSQLHLAVFRKLQSDNSTSFKLVDETYLENRTLELTDINQWIYVLPETPIIVQRGDYLGLFYDTLDETNEVPIYYTVNLPREKASQIIFPMVNRDVLYLNDKTVIVNGDIQKDTRIPALTAMVESVKNEQRQKL